MLPPGVFVLERGWLSSNNIVIAGKGPTAVIDSGYATHSAQTVGLVQSALQGQTLCHLLNTHLHSDHFGGNAALQAAYPSMATAIPPGLASAVRAWDTIALTYEPTGQVCPRFDFQELLQPGTELVLGQWTWQVHAAPGHDPHSVILFEPVNQCLISADALWENGFGVVFPELEGEHAFTDVAATLDLIESLAPAVVIPGHGRVFRDLPGALARARGRLDAYIASPRRHAAHAAKVLLKFKLLEVQEIEVTSLLAWANTTGYFTVVHRRWFTEMPLLQWLELMVAELMRSGAATLRETRIVNT
jgi:glyoxylase-like metal-dependent hydrolase (beta-lactamase superfamily II)